MGAGGGSAGADGVGRVGTGAGPAGKLGVEAGVDSTGGLGAGAGVTIGGAGSTEEEFDVELSTGGVGSGDIGLLVVETELNVEVGLAEKLEPVAVKSPL